jgi:hypothetical protein
MYKKQLKRHAGLFKALFTLFAGADDRVGKSSVFDKSTFDNLNKN